MSTPATPQQPGAPSTLRQKLASNDFGLPIFLVLVLIAFNKLVTSYEMDFAVRAWLWITNIGAVMVIVGMCGARVTKAQG
ncbi:unnamed protein product [Aureobasidium mustum]|uniref:Uncharacterized protein n=1 Tax=Aureobasidium mustum TaxID=2773714 RepID=A0A9N8K6X6_9PEZI|nr:unnamed protein product [Aureobasidium mustum]